MGFQISPAVAWSEKDLTTGVFGQASTGAAYAGVFKWGPVLEKTLIDGETTLADVFGKPDDDTFISFFTAANFLSYSYNLSVVRVVSDSALNATADGSGLLIENHVVYEDQYSGGEGDVGMWAARYPGTLGNAIKVSYADAGNYGLWAYKDYFDGVPGTSDFALKTGAKNDELHVVVLDATGEWTGTAGEVLERFAYVSKAKDAKAEDGSSNYYADVINRKSTKIWWMDHPDDATGWGENAGSTSFSTLDVTLVFPNPTSAYTVGETVTVKTGTLTGTTNLVGGSNFTSATVAITGGGGTGATATATITEGAVSAIVITAPGSGYRSEPTITISGDGTGATVEAVVTYAGNAVKSGTVISWDAPSRTMKLRPSLGTFTTTDKLTGATSAVGAIPTTVTYVDPTATLSGGADGNSDAADADYLKGYDIFLSEDFDFSFLLAGEASQAKALYLINSIAEVRKDCVAFISPPKDAVVSNAGSEDVDIVDFRNSLPSTSYGFMDSNWKYQYDKYNDKYRWIPLNGDIAGLAARSFEDTDPWYSFAGLNRGHIKNVVKLAWKPNKAKRDVLYKNSINPVTIFSGEGAVLYGDKTLLSKPSAFGSINVRFLFITLEKSIATAAKYTLFEFNDEFTRNQFRNMVEPFLRDVKGRRGVTNYLVVCDSTNNTGQVIDSQSFNGDIYITPARSINYIQLNFVATRTGVSFNEIVGRA